MGREASAVVLGGRDFATRACCDKDAFDSMIKDARASKKDLTTQLAKSVVGQ